MTEPVYFLTGFPGFIATRLLGTLLAQEPRARAVVLVEPAMAQLARTRAGALGGQRIEVLTGDISQQRLGLSDHDFERLAGEMTHAYHLAAIYDLAVPLEVAQRVNVDGTGNVLDLCLAAPGLERLHYVSTAYVAGLRRGVVYEHELVFGQPFKNHYESTKFQAEVWVRERRAQIPTTIYRPAIVVGDSHTGQTQKFDGPYFLLRLISRLTRQGLPLPQTGRSGALFNVVPIDFVVDAIAAVTRDDSAVGETLHLVDPDPLTAREMTRLLAREYSGREPSYRVPATLVQESLRLEAVRRLFGGIPRESVRYLNHPVRFDTRVANDVLAAAGVRCPRFGEYVHPMVTYFRAHEHDVA